MPTRVPGTAMTASGSTYSPVGNVDYKVVLSSNAGESNRVLVERKASLSSKRTLQLLNRAAATQRLKTVASLFSFKTDHNNRSDKSPATIPASSREQAIRLYNGPTVSMSEAWEARHDSPGPQAYNEGLKWRDKFKNVPSVRIGLAKCERDIVPPAAPGPGDYDIAHPAVGEGGNAIKFGDPGKRARYPPRTPDQPRAQVPCSYAEYTSSIQHHVTSDRIKSPAFPFSGAPRFQVRYSYDVNIRPRIVGKVVVAKGRVNHEGPDGGTACMISKQCCRNGDRARLHHAFIGRGWE